MKTLREQVADLVEKGFFSGEDIKDAAELLRDAARKLEGRANAIALDEFDAGDLVVLKPEHVTRRLPLVAVGKVERKGFKNLTVDFGVYRSWRIPASWLQKAPKGVKFEPRGKPLFGRVPVNVPEPSTPFED